MFYRLNSLSLKRASSKPFSLFQEIFQLTKAELPGFHAQLSGLVLQLLALVYSKKKAGLIDEPDHTVVIISRARVIMRGERNTENEKRKSEN